jgi:hypothetical protein
MHADAGEVILYVICIPECILVYLCIPMYIYAHVQYFGVVACRAVLLHGVRRSRCRMSASSWEVRRGITYGIIAFVLSAFFSARNTSARERETTDATVISDQVKFVRKRLWLIAKG